MSKYFYTNATRKGNKIYLRGYANGKRFMDDISYKPYLFLSGKGEWKTIYGESLFVKTFNTLKKAAEFIDLYGSASNVKFYGTTNFTFAFLNDEFPDKVDYDPSKISVVSLDIEVSSKNGMPDINLALEPVTTITMVRNGRTITLGYNVYKGKNQYVYCLDEKSMLQEFLSLINNDEYWSPDVHRLVSGFVRHTVSC